MVPTIISLQNYFETIRQAEVDRARRRLGCLSPEQELAIEILTRRIVNKIMHPPIRALKTVRESEAAPLTSIVKQLFDPRLCKKKSQIVQNIAIANKNTRRPAERTAYASRSGEPLSLAGL